MNVRNKLEGGEKRSAVFLDLGKTFDMVCHDLLLPRMNFTKPIFSRFGNTNEWHLQRWFARRNNYRKPLM